MHLSGPHSVPGCLGAPTPQQQQSLCAHGGGGLIGVLNQKFFGGFGKAWEWLWVGAERRQRVWRHSLETSGVQESWVAEGRSKVEAGLAWQ